MAKFGPLDDCVVMKVRNNFTSRSSIIYHTGVLFMFASTKFWGIAISEVFDNFCMETRLFISYLFAVWMICLGIGNYVWPCGHVLCINFLSI